jgi:hypothetical protein
MNADLDTRLRSAADSLQRAAERLAPSTQRPRSLRPAAHAVLGSMAVVALAVGILSFRDRPDETATLPPSPAAPRLIPEVLPPGHRPGGASELAVDPSVASDAVAIDVYGDPTADDPFAAADLLIYTSARPLVGDQLDELGETDPVTVRGHAGFADEFLGDGVLLLWEEAPGLSIGIGSWSLDLGDLLAIAEGLDVDAGAHTVELGRLPDGIDGPLAPVGSADDFASSPALAPLAVPVPAAGDGYVTYYRTDDYSFPGHVVVAAFTGDAADLAVARWFAAAKTATDVRGHPGWAGSFQLPPFDDGEGIVPESEDLFITTVVWEEVPGVVAIVQQFGHGEGDALALAESLRPASADEWARLLHLGESDDVLLTDDERIARGQPSARSRLDSVHIPMPPNSVNGAEGVYGSAGVWSTWLLPDGTLCGAVDDGVAEEPVVTCDPNGGPVTVIPDSTGQPALVIGVMPDGAVGRIAVGGDIEEAQTVTGPDDAPTYYVITIAGDAVPSAITFVDADGTDLASVPVDP